MSTKDKVKAVLVKKQGQFISGQDLADQLQVTRAAVWKAVDGLRKEGMEVEAVPKKGYRIISPIAPLVKEEIQRHLIDPLKDLDLYLYDTIDSTNTQAARLDQEGDLAHMTTILAEEQTQGRGRTGKSFDSPRGTGLYMSCLLKAQEGQDLNLDLLTIRACLAVYQAIEDLSLERPKIKWINDIYIGKKKISGILTEGSFNRGRLERIILGIGLNVFTQRDQFSPENQDKASSLFPKNFQRSQIAARILNQIHLVFNQMSDQEVLRIYKERNLVLGKEVSFSLKDIQYKGLAKDINNKGNLVVQVDDQEMVLTSGEVSIQGDW